MLDQQPTELTCHRWLSSATEPKPQKLKGDFGFTMLVSITWWLSAIQNAVEVTFWR
jgi:hypothetical protein